jgi:HlyD family secretion protein
MKSAKNNVAEEVLDYQPDAVEIEERPVPGKIRWVLHVILGSLVATVIGAMVFKVDRIVVAEGELVTTEPTIVVQPLTTAMVREIHVRIGDTVEKDQVLVTLDPTFASADLSQLTKQCLTLGVQMRRIKAELKNGVFAAKREEGEDGALQEQIFRQRKVVFAKNREMSEDKAAALEARLALNAVQRQGQEQQAKLLRDVEGTTAKLPQREGEQYRLRLLEAQKARAQATNAIESLVAEEQVTRNELKQVRSEWQRFVEERSGELMEQQVKLRGELERVEEELRKARRVHELVELRAPEKGVVLKIATRSVGSIIQQAEPFITLVPSAGTIEAEVDVETRDIGRIRSGDSARVKLDAFPFQRHDTLPGQVRVISEDAFQRKNPEVLVDVAPDKGASQTFYRTRIGLLSTTLRNVPEGFRLMPGMKVRAEIKVGRRSVISYFLYPIIRAFDESMREP